ncbi:barstar family protein [Pantoea sp. SOD02]|uniref:barstar family protein n=1 Tax=Pantoea sp. SOD02 TaxID=2970818 RepID=UPI00215786A4|nr:barstar family protein [Pantoea sp. SOD02]UVC32010.1 barstar family protein [Pantoea sp. SOD02]
MSEQKMRVNEFYLDGAYVLSEKEFHSIISLSLNFGPYYGKNLDALWDRLSTDIERPVKIIWLNSELSRVGLGNYFDKIIEVFERVKLQDLNFNWEEKFDYELQ